MKDTTNSYVIHYNANETNTKEKMKTTFLSIDLFCIFSRFASLRILSKSTYCYSH
jgi:hypothetical protein